MKLKSQKTRLIIKKIIRFSILTLALLMAIFYILSAFYTVNGYTIAFIKSPPESIYLKLHIFPLYIGPIPIMIPIYFFYTPTISQTMLFLLTIYLICLFKTFIDGRRDILSVITDIGNIKDNSFVALTSYTNVTLLIIVIIQQLQEKVGIETGKLIYKNELIKYLSISIAPLIEEIGFRCFIIGLFILVAIIRFLGIGELGLKNIIKILIYPSRMDPYIINRYGYNPIYKPTVSLIIISSLIFGSIHYIYGGGWEIGKITTASIAGILLGYLYYKYGLPASIMSHYFFNHLLMTYYYLGTTNLITLSVNAVIITQGLLVIIYIIYIIIAGVEKDEI